MGDDDSLEELLAKSRFDLHRALNLYFDSKPAARHARQRLWAAPDTAADTQPAADAQRHLAVSEENAAPRRARHPVGGLGRARQQGYCGPSADSGTGSSSCLEATDSSSTTQPCRTSTGSTGDSAAAVTSRDGRRGVRNRGNGRGGRSGGLCEVRNELGMLPIGREGIEGPCGVRYIASTGSAYEVDVYSMIQTNPETDNVREIRRSQPEVWCFRTDKNGWSRYPPQISHELERIYLERLHLKSGENSTLEGAQSAKRTGPSGKNAEPSRLAKSESALGQVNAMLAHEARLPEGAMPSDEVEAAKSFVLGVAVNEPQTAVACAELLERLAQRQRLVCTPADARRAGVLAGSMCLLKAVLLSHRSLQLVGIEIFDQKYPSMKLNVPGRKHGIRSLLARGMKLGSHAPTSKLLKKVEEDSVPLWEDRYLNSMLLACPHLPDHVLVKVRYYLSGGSRCAEAESE
eukprot:gnl/TRDRNA2_/TRDRNA2_139538_c0_seq1.p1 gnl/TRDRNA2_/TRDRNA2_139538_c0~~gnl/TRDRNA2_/TRDRNA2_139538_c0_seq1.p1  ORF type:complete len:491 (+),score=61.18 gnl/TRDRNA2_/TRDRNA2_139538_c0_seq1:91-1473(+)